MMRWPFEDAAQGIGTISRRAAMVIKEEDRVVETTATEARQGERGSSVLALLMVSTGLAVLILGVIWFVWFRVEGVG
ncbi:hypothetical protein RPD_1962 [Rhodopseudomonas palustris BisB5]|uniref:Uncharacterized protein n=2 Tax=Rhodopseudomonas TaxID=1073 RepID=Q139P2_RHOPS|nr:hypothetical protein RPD_1962 [Rhodopseudomonas palustris BisB5]